MLKSRSRSDTFQFFLLILLAVFVFLFFTRPIESEDVWWHLSSARWMLQNEQFPQMDIFSINSVQPEWKYVQWLGALIYYGIVQISGLTGLILFRTFLFFTALGIFYTWAHRKISFIWLIFFLFIMCFGLETRIWLRPMLFNHIFIQFFLIILLYYHTHGTRKILILIPLISALWNNFHLGCLVYGSILLGAFFSGYILEWLILCGKGEKYAIDRKVGLRKVLDLSLAMIAFFISFIVNPYGLDGAVNQFSLLLNRSSMLQQYFLVTIMELQPPAYIFEWRGAWFYILFTFSALSLFYNRRNGAPLMFLFIFSLMLFLNGQRAGAFLVVVCAYIIVYGAQQYSLKFRKPLEYIFITILGLVLAANVVHRFNQKFYIEGRLVRTIFQTLEPKNARDAVEFLNKHRIHGITLNYAGYGGQILWWGYPDLRPFVETRQIDPELYVDYLKLSRFPERYWTEIEKKYQFSIAVLSTKYLFVAGGKIYQALRELPIWRVIFLKGSNFIAVRQDVYKLPDALMSFEVDLRNVEFHLDKRILETLENAETPYSILKSFLNPPAQYIDLMEEGSLLYVLGFEEAGLARLQEAALATNDPIARQHFFYTLKHSGKSLP